MKHFLATLLFAIPAANAQNVIGTVLRLKPSSLTVTCNTGDIRTDQDDLNTLKVCRANTWTDIIDLGGASFTANRVLVTDSGGNPTASSITTTEVNRLSGVTSSVQTQLDNKQPLDSTLTALAAYNTNGLLTQTAADTFTGRTLTGTSNQVVISNGSGVSGNPTFSTPQDIHTGASPTFVTETLSGLTASRAVVTDGSKVLTSSATTATELGYVNGVTSAIQTQIDSKMTNPMTTGGDLIYGGSSGVPTRLANGTAGTYLRSNGGTSAPTWGPVTSIRLKTPNGFGAVNTKIRQMTGTVSSSGSDVTYANTANAGTSLTINTTGVYAITYCEEGNLGVPLFGLSLNSATLTTDLNSIAVNEILALSNVSTGNSRACVAWTGSLTANDVVRPHTNQTTTEFVTSNIGILTITGPL